MFLPCINKHDHDHDHDDDDDDDDKLSLCRPSFKYLSHPWGEGWSCNIHSMVLPIKISSHCAGSLACFKYLSYPWGEGVEL